MNSNIVNAGTKIFAILGHPVHHCMSPVIMNRSFERMGLDCVFLALKCDVGDVDVMMRALKNAELQGYVFTMPVKEKMTPYLDELREEAEITGAVNCVQNQSGRLIGYNTDSLGFWSAVQEKNQGGVKIKKVFLMGMGGFAKAAAVQAALQGVKEIVAVNHFSEKAYVDSFRSFQERLLEKVPDVQVELADWNVKDWPEELNDSDVIVNATSNGLNGIGDLDRIFPYGAVPDHALFFDAVYTPVETAYLKAAKKRGHRIIGGLDLLAHQGACSFKLWTGLDVSPSVMYEDAAEFLAESR